jgi:hypothetical protein
MRLAAGVVLSYLYVGGLWCMFLPLQLHEWHALLQVAQRVVLLPHCCRAC